MRKKKTNKYALAAKFAEESSRSNTPTPEWQRRMFRIAATVGRELEPVGALAGRPSLDSLDASGQ